jgi:hypothetical protein
MARSHEGSKSPNKSQTSLGCPSLKHSGSSLGALKPAYLNAIRPGSLPLANSTTWFGLLKLRSSTTPPVGFDSCVAVQLLGKFIPAQKMTTGCVARHRSVTLHVSCFPRCWVRLDGCEFSYLCFGPFWKGNAWRWEGDLGHVFGSVPNR